MVCTMRWAISIPSEDYIEAVDYFGIASGRDEDKLSRAGLTPVRSELVDAPYVREFPVAIECRLIKAEDLGLHTLFVGEVLDVKGDPAMVEDGRLDIEKIRPPIYDPARNRYFGVGKYLARAFRAGKKLAP